MIQLSKNKLNISVIIPTLNRSKELKQCLLSIANAKNHPLEVLLVDQSSNMAIEKISHEIKHLQIRYFYQNIQSWALARNIGIEKLNRNTDIVVFLDDDVIVQEDFFEEIIKFFLNDQKVKWWVANIQTKSNSISFLKKIWLFLLSWSLKGGKTYITWWWANIISFSTPHIITPVEWTHWCGMFFRKSVFDEGFRFEAQFMKYSFMEDCFLSYAIHQKYPNSLFFVPSIKLTHIQSPLSRLNLQQKIYQSIIHRYYFIKKFHKNFYLYLWSLWIYALYDIIQYRTFKIIKYYYQWLKYILKHKNQIWNSKFDFKKFIFW